MDIPQTAAAFLRQCEVERRLSPNTIMAYGQDLAEFRRHFAGANDVRTVTGAALVAFVVFRPARLKAD